jgi:hypothetical protein
VFRPGRVFLPYIHLYYIRFQMHRTGPCLPAGICLTIERIFYIMDLGMVGVGTPSAAHRVRSRMGYAMLAGRAEAVGFAACPHSRTRPRTPWILTVGVTCAILLRCIQRPPDAKSSLHPWYVHPAADALLPRQCRRVQAALHPSHHHVGASEGLCRSAENHTAGTLR